MIVSYAVNTNNGIERSRNADVGLAVCQAFERMTCSDRRRLPTAMTL
jgi:hypothetical protein